MKRSLCVIAALVILIAGGGVWYVHSKQPVRSGEIALMQLKAPVSVRYDERGVPHIKAENQDDLYRALGYVHAQDRLFQMEILRRLARGELAEVLGPKLVTTDKLFRSLRIREPQPLPWCSSASQEPECTTRRLGKSSEKRSWQPTSTPPT